MFVTVGLLLLTLLYIGMVIAIENLSPVECLEDLCQSEAVDNTILNWASDFFLAFWIFVFALHLSFCAGRKRGIRKTALLSQIFMGGAFIMAGVANWLYPNSGIDDNHGLLGYWIAWMMFAILFTISAIGMAQFALRIAENHKRTPESSLCTNKLLVASCVFALVSSLIGFLTGTMWCATQPDLHVEEIVENFEETNEVHVCFNIMKYSAVAIHFTYALLWLPAGLLMKEASQKRPQIFLGLPTPIAAVIAMVTQWTVGSLFFAIIFTIGLFPTVDYFDIWNKIYGTVLYHWAMLMTLYCLHNLSYGQPLRYDDNGEEISCSDDGYDSDDEPLPLSWEWWVTMAAGVVSEPEEAVGARQKEKFKEENGAKKTKRNTSAEEPGPITLVKKSVSFGGDEEIAI